MAGGLTSAAARTEGAYIQTRWWESPRWRCRSRACDAMRTHELRSAAGAALQVRRRVQVLQTRGHLRQHAVQLVGLGLAAATAAPSRAVRDAMPPERARGAHRGQVRVAQAARQRAELVVRDVAAAHVRLGRCASFGKRGPRTERHGSGAGAQARESQLADRVGQLLELAVVDEAAARGV